jgi:hypothetical protein
LNRAFQGFKWGKLLDIVFEGNVAFLEVCLNIAVVQCLDSVTARPGIPLSVRRANISFQEKRALVKPEANHKGEEDGYFLLLFFVAKGLERASWQEDLSYREEVCS